MKLIVLANWTTRWKPCQVSSKSIPIYFWSHFFRVIIDCFSLYCLNDSQTFSTKMLRRHVGAGGSHEERLVVVSKVGAELTKVGISDGGYPRQFSKSEVKNRSTGEPTPLSRILIEKKLIQADLERSITAMLQYLC